LLFGKRLSNALLLLRLMLRHVWWQLEEQLHWRSILVAAFHVVNEVGWRLLLMLGSNSFNYARVGVLLKLLL